MPVFYVYEDCLYRIEAIDEEDAIDKFLAMPREELDNYQVLDYSKLHVEKA